MTDINKKSSSQEKIIHDYFDSLLQDDLNIKNKELKHSVPIVEKIEKSFVKKQQHKISQPALKKSISPEILMPLNKSDEKISSENIMTKPVMGLDQLIAEIPKNSVEKQLKTATKTESKIDLKSINADNDHHHMIDESPTPNPHVGVNTEGSPISENGVPDWAETRFQCLLFNVSGLNLAVPLIKLNSVIPWDKNITTTPNKTKWYLGLVQHLQNQVKIIDTALLVLPENRRQNLSDDSNGRVSHILLVDNFKWGLACSRIGEVIWLSKEEVKWRKNKASKVWLAGTSLEHLCAIMDTEVFAKMLNEST